MDEDWPLTHERHTTNCPAFIRSTTVSEGGGCSFSALTYSPWWSTRVNPSRGIKNVILAKFGNVIFA
jgi:hypothetical protein